MCFSVPQIPVQIVPVANSKYASFISAALNDDSNVGDAIEQYNSYLNTPSNDEVYLEYASDVKNIASAVALGTKYLGPWGAGIGALLGTLYDIYKMPETMYHVIINNSSNTVLSTTMTDDNGADLILRTGETQFATAFDPDSCEVRLSPIQEVGGVASGSIAMYSFKKGSGIDGFVGVEGGYHLAFLDSSTESPVGDLYFGFYQPTGDSTNGIRAELNPKGSIEEWVTMNSASPATRYSLGDTYDTLKNSKVGVDYTLWEVGDTDGLYGNTGYVIIVLHDL